MAVLRIVRYLCVCGSREYSLCGSRPSRLVPSSVPSFLVIGTVPFVEGAWRNRVTSFENNMNKRIIIRPIVNADLAMLV